MAEPVPVDVLIVEDDEAIRTSWGEILRLAGWKVAEVPDAFFALEYVREAAVGAIVLDVRMLALDGFGLLDRLDDPPPVIVTSGARYDSEVEARQDKIHAYLTKPVSPDSLIAVVASALAKTARRP